MNDYIIDDGSIEAQVLQHQQKGTVIKVKPNDKLDNWLVDIIEENDDIVRVFLPFSYEQMTVGIRAEINTALYNYPKLRIVLPFEQMDQRTVNNKATQLGITNNNTGPVDDKLKTLIEENREKAKVIDYGNYSVGGNDSVIPNKKRKKKVE